MPPVCTETMRPLEAPPGPSRRAELNSMPGPGQALASASQSPALLLPPGLVWVLWPRPPLPPCSPFTHWSLLWPGWYLFILPIVLQGFVCVRFSFKCPPHCRIVVLQFQSLACLLKRRSWTLCTDVSRCMVWFRWFKDPPKNWYSRRSIHAIECSCLETHSGL